MSKHHNGFRIMDKMIFQAYKKAHNTLPRCISCGNHLFVDMKFITLTGHTQKYVCENCSERFDKTGLLVFQYPQPQKHFIGEKYYDKLDENIKNL